MGMWLCSRSLSGRDLCNSERCVFTQICARISDACIISYRNRFLSFVAQGNKYMPQDSL